MTNLSSLTSQSLVRGSRQNSLITSYTFFFTQPQAINQTTAAIYMTFPVDFSLNSSNFTCSTGSTSVNCSLSGSSRIILYFTPIQADSYFYNFTIIGIRNPISYKPTTSIIITTLTSDLLYSYSSTNTGF